MKTPSALKRAIVTGSSSGIGRAVVERLLGDGWQVDGIDRTPATVVHEHFSAISANLADADVVHSLQQRLGTPDAVVHAAGVMRTAKLGKLREDDARLMWQLHAGAATHLADLLLPRMAEAGSGRMVLIGSRVSGGMPGRSLYAASKAALVALARSWAAEIVSQGVTVNVVSPAATDTAMLKHTARADTPPKPPPFGRLIQPAEVAALVAFLLSNEAAAITGQDIAICGGASLPR